ncbi:MAG: SPL family radical SAM protein [Candidatus Loosdrechtia sp.]|uniref:SPL family radical SAM protein n=1 Tax=Candidatus Loosdrechtia sp. TaxID=3101272 RepID=UPI003A7524F9|nr:MAG: hypothetical protein QY305_06940 [Candidatus Jettenia sp. AMX2]
MMLNPEEIKTFVNSTYPYLGKNKRQEISRLLYEIAKRERTDYTKITGLLPQPPGRFNHIKDYLLKRRYPSLTKKGIRVRPSFGSIAIHPELKASTSGKSEIRPKKLFIEESVLASGMTRRIMNQFPESSVEVITTYKDHIGRRRFGIDDYNKRLECFYLIRERYDFYKPCPCSHASLSCNYFIVNLGSGCPYECAYCVLQDYINSPGIILPANIEDFFTALEARKQDIRCGSGELTDSLAFDYITGYSPQIVEFFRQHPKSIFEFKTKSDNIGLLTSVPGTKNVVVSWSMNPQQVVDTVEYATASLVQRLEAARTCIDCGYSVAFHFDPIVYYQGWEAGYEALIHTIFNTIDRRSIVWLSLGTLRMTPRLKKIIENRFPENTILDEEFLVGYDGKLRYPQDVRISMYKGMTSWIRKYSKDVPVYLCMEEGSMRSAMF